MNRIATLALPLAACVDVTGPSLRTAVRRVTPATVFDQRDNLIAEDDGSGESTDVCVTVKLPPGRYYIAATSFDGGERRNYTLFVEKQPTVSLQRTKP
jgi:hypothetical protein